MPPIEEMLEELGQGFPAGDPVFDNFGVAGFREFFHHGISGGFQCPRSPGNDFLGGPPDAVGDALAGQGARRGRGFLENIKPGLS